jgi:hypothetical protein
LGREGWKGEEGEERIGKRAEGEGRERIGRSRERQRQ